MLWERTVGIIDVWSKKASCSDINSRTQPGRKMTERECSKRICTVYVQFMYSLCTVYVQFMYSLCTAYVQLMYSLCTAYVHVQLMYSLCTAYVQLMYSLCTVYAYSLYVQFM
jgi:hypothetical protein